MAPENPAIINESQLPPDIRGVWKLALVLCEISRFALYGLALGVVFTLLGKERFGITLVYPALGGAAVGLIKAIVDNLKRPQL